MIEESRKPFLREVFAKHKPSQWHKLVDTDITRQEWMWLCQQWHVYTKNKEYKELDRVKQAFE